jgi:hypothetical protein
VGASAGRVYAALLASVLTGAIAHAAELPESPKTRAQGALARKVDVRLIPALKNQQAAPPGSVFSRALAPRFNVRLDLNITEAVLAAIRGAGATVVHASPRWKTVSVRAAAAQILLLKDLPQIRSIKIESEAATMQQGVADNQGDIALKTNLARSNFGLTGAGQKIGVLSDTINRTTKIGAGTVTGTVPNAFLSNTNPQNSNDLPSSIQVLDFGPATGIDEGAAMLELIHDIAPGAALAFASGMNSQTQFADNIRQLRTIVGCGIIVDDVLFFEEPMFQDGPIAQAITENAAAGAVHLTVACNYGADGTLTSFNDVDPANSSAAEDPDGSDFHNWGIGGATPAFLPIQVPNGSRLRVVMQWNEPWQSYGLGSGSRGDYDMYLYNAPSVSAVKLASSAQLQGDATTPAGDPVESIVYVNSTGSAQTVYLTLDHYGGVTGTAIRVVFPGDKVTFPSGGISGMTIYGHPASAEAVTVGAVFYGDILSGGKLGSDTTNINAQTFSGRGGIGSAGVPLYFDTSGNALSGGPLRRNKPDVVAPDGVNNTKFGTDQSQGPVNGVTYDADSLPNFTGTSAAAPNAAAVAALIRQRSPNSSPAQIKALLMQTAIDIVASSPLSVTGPDDRTGAGLIDGLAAVNALPGLSQQPQSHTALVGQAATFAVTATGAGPLNYQWQENGLDIPGATAAAYTIASCTKDRDGNFFRCIITNAYGQAASAAAQLNVNEPPSIVDRPVSQTIVVGENATFSVIAAGDSPLSYQWQKNGVAIPGATAAMLTLNAVSKADDGSVFRCIVSNPFGSATSMPATLSAIAPIIVLQQPQTILVNEGSWAEFSVAVNGDGPLQYRWQRNGVDIPGATANVVRFTASAEYDQSAVCCVVSNDREAIKSEAATLRLNFAPRLISPLSAAPNVAVQNTQIAFSLDVDDAQSVTHHWDFGDGAAPIETASGVLTHLYAAAGTYLCTVTIIDALGLSTTTTATVLIQRDTDGDGIADGIDADSDGDGFSDEFEAAAGTSTQNAAATPAGCVITGAPSAFTLKKLTVKSGRNGEDTVQLTGSLNVRANFPLGGECLLLRAGDLVEIFRLDPKGSATTSERVMGRCKVRTIRQKQQPDATLQMIIQLRGPGLKAKFGQTLNASTARVQTELVIFLGGRLYSALDLTAKTR